MFAILKRANHSDTVCITINREQELEQFKSWAAPDATVSLPKADRNRFPDFSTFSAQDFEQIQSAFTKAVKALPSGTVFSQSSNYYTFSSPEDFKLRCSEDEDFKAIWAPYLI